MSVKKGDLLIILSVCLLFATYSYHLYSTTSHAALVSTTQTIAKTPPLIALLHSITFMGVILLIGLELSTSISLYLYMRNSETAPMMGGMIAIVQFLIVLFIVG